LKKVGCFFLGSLVGVVLVFILFYASGYVFDYLEIQLYKSEADQQRNFNIFVGTSVLFAILFGSIFVKKLRPKITQKKTASK